MSTPLFAIMRFAKYKGPEISRIEAHNERTKEKYASNPDVDTARSHMNYHLIEPKGHYRQEAERQIAEAGCRTRSDSVRLVETLITGSPEFFKGKSSKQIKEYFAHALAFLQQYQRSDTIVSAVVHLDEKTPHMHVTFVPLTESWVASYFYITEYACSASSEDEIFLCAIVEIFILEEKK